jgi:hypothetical protein
MLPHRSVCALLDHVCARFRLDHRTVDGRMYEPTEDETFAPIGEVLVQHFDALRKYQQVTAPSGSYTVLVHVSWKYLTAATIQVTAQKRHGVCAAQRTSRRRLKVPSQIGLTVTPQKDYKAMKSDHLAPHVSHAEGSFFSNGVRRKLVSPSRQRITV